MVHCSNCGEKLLDNAYFCHKCGVRTKQGFDAGITTPMEDLKDTVARVGEEMEKAFSIAGREMEKAFKTARDKIRESTSREPVVCSKCDEKNVAGSKFCSKCGKKLTD